MRLKYSGAGHFTHGYEVWDGTRLVEDFSKRKKSSAKNAAKDFMRKNTPRRLKKVAAREGSTK